MFSLVTQIRRLALVCIGTGLAGAALAAEPASPLALSCLGCHQPAVDAREMPALAHLTPEQISAALREARDHPQTGSIMARLVAHLSDDEIAKLGAELGTSGKP